MSVAAPSHPHYGRNGRTLQSVSLDRGATAVEYALLASLIAAIVATIVGMLGVQVRDMFATLLGAF